MLAVIGLMMVVSLSIAVISLSTQEEHGNASTTGTTIPYASTTSTPIPYNTPFSWSEYQWRIVNRPSKTWIDMSGNLHMVLTYSNGIWHDYNIYLDTPVHYGTFSTTVQTNLSYIENTLDGGFPSFCFAMYLYDNNLPHGGELDIEQCRFVEAPTHTLHWTNHYTDVVHPNPQITAVNCLGGNVTHTLTWQPKYIKWEADGGTTGHLEHTEAVPALCPPDTTGTMRCIFFIGADYGGGRAPPTDPYSIEVVVANFSWQPQPAASTLAIASIATPTAG